MQELGFAASWSERAMCGLTDHSRVVSVGDDQPCFARQVSFLLEDSGKAGRHRPEKAVAIVEIVSPFAVSEKVSLRDLNLDDGQTALRINRHEIRTAAVRKRHFADCEEVLSAQ